MLSPLQKLLKSYPQLDEHLTRREMFGNEAIAILPAGLVKVASGAAKLWCVARSLDHPDNRGNGCGIVSLTLDELAGWLGRSTRTVWRYLQEALKAGFIHRHWWKDDRLYIEYVGLKPLAKRWGLKTIGAVGMFRLTDIRHAKAKAAEIAAEDLQRQSFHLMKESYGKYAKGAKSAAELLALNTSSARVSGGVLLARGHRLAYFSPHWRPFGGSQATISDRLGVSPRTVQYRLCNTWRESRGLEPINKVQTAHQVHEECPKAFLRDFMRCEENSHKKYVFLGARLFKIGCNLYSTSVLLRGYRYRKAEYRQTYYNAPASVAVENDLAGDTTRDYIVCDSGFKEVSELLISPKKG